MASEVICNALCPWGGHTQANHLIQRIFNISVHILVQHLWLKSSDCAQHLVITSGENWASAMRDNWGNRAQVGRDPKNGVRKLIQDAAWPSPLTETQRSSFQSHTAPAPGPSHQFRDCASLWNRTISTLFQPIIILGEVIEKSRHYVNIGILDTILQEQQNNDLQNP